MSYEGDVCSVSIGCDQVLGQQQFRVSGIVVAALVSLVLTGTADAAKGSASRVLAASRSVATELSNSGNAAVVGAAVSEGAGAQAPVRSLIADKLSARQLAGQRVIYSYSGLQPPAKLLYLIRHGQAAGVIFFRSNYANRTQFTRAVRALEAANAAGTNPVRAYPLLLMTDQEGGTVRRLPGAPVLSAKAIGQKQPLSAAEKAARQAGLGAASNLRSYGLNVNLAPVLDVYRKAGDFDDRYGRSYSMNPGVVSALGAAFIRAQQGGKVAATAKHFPGLGRATATQNTDIRAVTINLSRSTLQAKDEYPYRAAIAAGVKLVMVSWAKYPALDPKLPAGLSKTIVQGQLRSRLGFGGVTITDAIGAGALTAYGPVQNRAKLAAAAGMNLILSAVQNTGEGIMCVDGLQSAYLRGSAASRAGFRHSVTQILTLRASLPA